MRWIVDFLKSCFVLAVGLLLITVGMAIAQTTVSNAFTDEYRQVVEVGVGFALAALWIWAYVLFAMRASGRVSSVSVEASTAGSSRFQLIERELREASSRVRFTHRVAMICVILAVIAVCTVLLIPLFGKEMPGGETYKLAFGFFVSILGGTLMAYYRRAERRLAELLQRAERIASLEQARSELDRAPDTPDTLRKRQEVVDFLMSLAMTKPGQGPTAEPKQNRQNSDQSALSESSEAEPGGH